MGCRLPILWYSTPMQTLSVRIQVAGYENQIFLGEVFSEADRYPEYVAFRAMGLLRSLEIAATVECEDGYAGSRVFGLDGEHEGLAREIEGLVGQEWWCDFCDGDYKDYSR